MATMSLSEQHLSSVVFLILLSCVHGSKQSTFPEFKCDDPQPISCAKELLNSLNDDECLFDCVKTNDSCNVNLPSVNLSSFSFIENDDFEFIVEPEFYERKIFSQGIEFPVVGLNISVKLTSNLTSGYVFHAITEKWNLCYILDIHKLKRPQKKLITLWNDAFFVNENADIRLEVTEFPSNKTRYFFSKKPSEESLKDIYTLKEWTPLIFIEEKLPYNSIGVIFKSAPRRFGNVNYIVQLKSRNDGQKQIISSPEQVKDTFHRVVFSNLKRNVYNITVQANCADCKKGSFEINFLGIVEDENLTSVIIIIILVLITVIVCMFILFRCKPWLYLFKSKLPNKEIPIPKAVVIYSYDSNEHSDAVDAFVTALKSDGVNILYDKYREEISPKKWLCDSIEKSDFVIIIWSEGTVLKYENDKEKLKLLNEPGNLTSACISQAFRWIIDHHLTVTRKTVANVCWQRQSFKNRIPNQFSGCKTFTIPKDWVKLHRFLFRQNKFMEWIYHSPTGPEPLKMLPDKAGKKLETALNNPNAYILKMDESTAHVPVEGLDNLAVVESEQVDSGNFSLTTQGTGQSSSDFAGINIEEEQEREKAVKEILQGSEQPFVQIVVPDILNTFDENVSYDEYLSQYLQNA